MTDGPAENAENSTIHTMWVPKREAEMTEDIVKDALS
jgi:hypothetical protein